MKGTVEAIKSEKRMLLKKFLTKNKSRNETLYTYNQDSIFTLDIDGHFVQGNPAFEKISGYSAEEAKQLKLQSLFSIEHLNKVFHHFHKAVLGHFPNFDCKMTTKNGLLVDVNITNIPISVDDQIVGVCAVARNITELKRKKEEVRKIEEMQRILTDNVLDLIISTNMQGEIHYVSPSCEHILGYAPDEVIKQNFISFIHIEDAEKAFMNRKRVLSNLENGRDSFRIRKKDGDFIWVESLCKPVTDPDTRNVLEVVSVFRNISERKMTQELLLNSEKLSVAGTLAAGIAHEVRNPLTSIKGFLQLMKAGSDNQTYFDIIESEIDRIELILSELLVLSKPHELKYETVDIITLIENVKTLIDPQAIMNDVHIETIYRCTSITINCDKNQLKQVFINILKNAIEAMPRGGLITIELKKHSFTKLKLFFKDTGSGMPQHILKRLGEPFFTTKENGTGLGIMISKQIIENHDGTIHFWSDQKGTIIEVILPMVKHHLK